MPCKSLQFFNNFPDDMGEYELQTTNGSLKARKNIFFIS